MIKINNLSFNYGEHEIFNNFNLSIPDNFKTVKIVGKSGAGKSTLVKLIAGIIKPKNGQISTLGSVLYLPQNAKEIFIPGQSIKLLIDSLQTSKIKELFFTNLELIGLNWDKVSCLTPMQISGGEAQKILLAIGFSLTSDIIIIDETTSAMDKGSVENVIKLIRKYSGHLLIIDHKKNFPDTIYDSQIII